MEEEKILDLIRKCLALAGSPNEKEAAAALAKAQDLLDKYNLDLVDVTVEQDITPEVLNSEWLEYGSEWKRSLYVGIAKQNFCTIIGSREKKSVKVFGRLPNVIATYEMVNWLSSQLERLAFFALESYNGYFLSSDGRLVRGDSTRQFRIDFLLGAVQRVIVRLEELNTVRRNDIPGAFALAVRLVEEAKEVRNQMFPNRGSHHISVRKGSEGYYQGIKAGDNVGIVPPSRHVTKDNGLYLSGGR